MDAIKLLDEQHDDVDALFEEIESASGRRKGQLFEQLADALAMHATIEEKIFYPAVRASNTEDILRESLEEHLGVKRVLADLLKASPDDETFDAKIKVLKEMVEHHVEEERADLFPRVRKLLSADQLEAIGQQMQAMMAELEGTEPRQQVPRETRQAAPLP